MTVRRAPRRTRTVAWPTTTTDGRSLEARITAGVAAAVDTVAEDVAAQTAVVRLLERAELRTAQLELAVGRRGGTVVLEPAGGFTAEQIGAPVLVVQAPGRSIREAELGLVLFVGEVINARQLRIGWFSSEPAPRVVSIHYIIGSR